MNTNQFVDKPPFVGNQFVVDKWDILEEGGYKSTQNISMP